jgi:hypothetical protein
MNLHREFIQNRGHKGITRKPKPAGEEVAKNNNFVGFGGRNLLIEGSATVARRKESGCPYSLIKLVVTLDSPKTKDGGRDLERFATISSLGSASTSPISSPSDLISPLHDSQIR